MADASAYTTGGTVQASTGTYIPRQADADLLNHCLNAGYAYILAARQVGKSSLMVNVARQLRQRGVRPALVDLTTVGQTNVDASRWYLGILSALEARLQLSGDVFEWWAQHAELSYSDRFILFFKSRILVEISSPVVVFFDEIDTTLELKFTDDFFAAIRYLYNARSEEPALARLSFVLIGVATPTDLIKDSQRTPFNIGKPIDLDDFSREETLVLATPLGLPLENTREVVQWILSWTGGQPYLTQRLLRAMAEEERSLWTEGDVEAVVERIFFGDQSGRDFNLYNVGSRLSKDSPYTYRMLSKYAQILRGIPPVLDNEQSPVKAHLKLSGVVARSGPRLVVRNAIYERVFNLEWVSEQRAVRHEEAARRAIVVAVVFAIAALVLAAFSFFKSREATRNAADFVRERTLREEADRQKDAADLLRKRAEVETLRADATAGALKNALMKAGLSQKEAEKQAAIAVKQQTIAIENSKAADSSKLLAEQRRKEAEDNQHKAEDNLDLAKSNQKQAESSAADATRNQVLANEKVRDNEAKAKQLLVYKIISDANLMRVARSDLADEAALLSAEAYRLLGDNQDGRAEAIQGLEGALDKLPRIIGHPSGPGPEVTSLALNESGTELAVGLVNGQIYHATLPGDLGNSGQKLSGAVGNLGFAGWNGLVQAIDSNGNATPGLPSSSQRVLALASDASAYVTSTPDPKVLNYWTPGQPSPRLLHHHAKVKLATFSSSFRSFGDNPTTARELYVLCDDNSATLWRLDSFRASRIQLPTDAGSAGALLFSATGGWQPFRSLFAYSKDFSSGSRLLLGSGNFLRSYSVGSILKGWGPFEREIFSARLGATLAHDTRISFAAMVPGSDYVTTASGTTVRRWQISTGREVLRQDLGKPVTALAISNDDRVIATARTGGDVKVWLSEAGPIVAKHPGRTWGSVAFSPNGQQVLAVSINGVQSWNWRSGATTNNKLEGATTTVFSANGRTRMDLTNSVTAATAPARQRARTMYTRTLLLSNLATNESQSYPLEAAPRLFALSPDGQFAATLTGVQLRVYSEKAPTILFEYAKNPSRMAVGPASGQVALSLENSVEVLSSDGKSLASLEGAGSALSFSRDGKYLAVAARDGVHFYDTATWKVTDWRIVQNPVTDMGFSPNNASLVTLGGGSLRIWDIRAGTQTFAVSSVSWYSFSSDGKYLATGGVDGLKVWVWRPEDLVAEICGRVVSPVLSAPEWKKYLGDEPFHATCPAR